MDWDNGNFHILDKYELLDFFGSDPVDESIEDGYWCYEALDSRSFKLRFSFNVFEKSIQTEILMNDESFSRTSYEGNVRMSLREDKLHCEFVEKEIRTVLTISVKEGINVVWSTLRIV